MIKKVVIVCPSGASGGQEALHQLCHIINTNVKEIDAFMHYYGPGEKIINERFRHYNLKTIREVRESDDHLIIIPEIFAFLIYKFKRSKVGLWWLSIDGYYTVKKYSRRNRIKEFFGLLKWPDLNNMDSRVLNLYQSEYARIHLSSEGAFNLFALSDFTKEEFLNSEDDLHLDGRKNIVCYNPKKGYEITSRLKELYPDIKWVPLINLTPNQIKRLLLESKVYIDFGNHPGKDRFPREAASSGVVVITNMVGSAGNNKDLPLDAIFKIENPLEDHQEVYNLIKDIFIDYKSYFNKQSNYRSIIRNERTVFIEEINCILKNTK